MTCTLKDAYILIADHKFTQVKELLPILEQVSATDKSLLIIAEDIDNEALATLIVNKARGTLKVCAIKAPDFGDRRKLILEDIATLTNGVVFDKDKGMKLDKFSWDWFGEARAITISKSKTTIVDGKGTEEAINKRVDELTNQIDNSTTPFETEQLQNRLAKMVGGVSIIHVGGFNETEMNEKKDRVDDALNATQAALSEGVIPGGGVALAQARKVVASDSIGSEIVRLACKKPFKQILENAGISRDKIEFLDKEISTDGEWKGYDIKQDKVVDFKENGIIDPLKVTRTALENAAAVAGTVLLTECVVVEEESENNQPQLNGMF